MRAGDSAVERKPTHLDEASLLVQTELHQSFEDGASR